MSNLNKERAGTTNYQDEKHQYLPAQSEPAIHAGEEKKQHLNRQLATYLMLAHMSNL